MFLIGQTLKIMGFEKACKLFPDIKWNEYFFIKNKNKRFKLINKYEKTASYGKKFYEYVLEELDSQWRIVLKEPLAFEVTLSSKLLLADKDIEF